MNPKQVLSDAERATGFKIGDRVRVIDREVMEDKPHIVRGVAVVIANGFSFVTKLEIAEAGSLAEAMKAYKFRIHYVDPWQIQHWPVEAEIATAVLPVDARPKRRRSPANPRRLF